MILTVERSSLVAALKDVSHAAGRKSVTEQHVLIEANPGLTLTCTDMDMWATRLCDTVSVDRPGAICVPVDAFSRFVDSLPDGGQVSLTAADLRLTVKCGRPKATFGGLDPEVFPRFNLTAEKGATVELPSPTLRKLLSRVYEAAGKNDLQPMLGGTHMFSGGGSLVAEATDTDVLFRQSVTVAGDIPSVIIPSKSVRSILRVLTDDGDASLTVTPAYLGVKNGAREFRTRLIAEQYPNVDGFLPKQHQTLATVKTAELREVIQRLMTIRLDNERMLRLSFSATGIEVTTGDKQADAGEDAVAAKVEGPDAVRMVNASKLLAFLAPVPTSEVTLRMPADGVMITAEVDGWYGLVMGLRR